MADIFYTKDHEWIKVNGDEGVVGITSYASEQLGDIVFVELPEKGNSFDQGKDVAVIESVKAASEIYSPASGEIFETNSSLEEKPEIINEQLKQVNKTIKELTSYTSSSNEASNVLLSYLR